MASMAAIVESVADLLIQRADVYRVVSPVVPTDTGDTTREYTLFASAVPCSIFWSGGKQFGLTPQQDFGYRVVVSPVVGLFFLDAPILERDRIVVDSAPYNVLFVRIEYDNTRASHLLAALERAAVEPFLDGGAE
jgi:hypothetical protein